jgi:DNA-binding transcriptional regulator YbjK
MDVREKVIAAGLWVLREEAFTAFTQPRVCRQAGVRQSHLTYYFPTWTDLLVAVAERAVQDRLAAISASLDESIDDPRVAAAKVARAIASTKDNRAFLALAEAADQEPRVRAAFRELTDGIAGRASQLLAQLGIEPTEAAVRLVHSLTVGVVVLGVARGEEVEADATSMLLLAFELLASKQPRKRRAPKDRGKGPG